MIQSVELVQHQHHLLAFEYLRRVLEGGDKAVGAVDRLEVNASQLSLAMKSIVDAPPERVRGVCSRYAVEVYDKMPQVAGLRHMLE